MNKGEIVEVNDALSIYKEPKSAYTQKLIDAIPTGELSRIIEIQETKNMINE